MDRLQDGRLTKRGENQAQKGRQITKNNNPDLNKLAREREKLVALKKRVEDENYNEDIIGLNKKRYLS